MKRRKDFYDAVGETRPKVHYSDYYIDRSSNLPRIKKVLFRAPATIVFWDDNTKTVVKCSENDIYDCEKGMAMAIAKKFLGNEGNYYNEFKKWLPEEEDEYIDEMLYPTIPDSIIKSFTDAGEAVARIRNAIINRHKGE